MDKQKWGFLAIVIIAGLLVGGYSYVKQTTLPSSWQLTKIWSVFTTQSYRGSEVTKKRSVTSSWTGDTTWTVCCWSINGSTIYDFDDQGDSLTSSSPELCACGQIAYFKYIGAPWHFWFRRCVDPSATPEISECTATEARCGDGIVNGYEECDDGDPEDEYDPDDECNHCIFTGGTYCGDGIIQTPNSAGNYEECDDGSTINGDGCSNTCQIEGSATCQSNADCPEDEEDGYNVCTLNVCSAGMCKYYPVCALWQVCIVQGDSQTVWPVCLDEIPICGNESIDSGEECDDGNLVKGDGCDDNCQLEITCDTDSDCPEDSVWICTTNVCKEGTCMYYDACPDGRECSIAGTPDNQRVECFP